MSVLLIVGVFVSACSHTSVSRTLGPDLEQHSARAASDESEFDVLEIAAKKYVRHDCYKYLEARERCSRAVDCWYITQAHKPFWS